MYPNITEEVRQVSKMNFSGNIIPNHWFNEILKDTGKPDLDAIIILSEIVYWYRWVEIRDDHGITTGHRKRFEGDLLQKSYSQLSEKFGISERQARNAVVRLETLGYIRREFATVTKRDRSIPNVMFIRIFPESLRSD